MVFASTQKSVTSICSRYDTSVSLKIKTDDDQTEDSLIITEILFLISFVCVLLNYLLDKNEKKDQSANCQAAFEKFKQLLASDLLLTHYDPSLPIMVALDAPNYGVITVISHIFPNGSEKAISYAARSLTIREQNCSQIVKEALSIIYTVNMFLKMIFGQQPTLITDYKPLLAVFGSKKGIPVHTANRPQR